MDIETVETVILARYFLVNTGINPGVNKKTEYL